MLVAKWKDLCHGKFVVSSAIVVSMNSVICGQFQVDFSPFHNKLNCNFDINV